MPPNSAAHRWSALWWSLLPLKCFIWPLTRSSLGPGILLSRNWRRAHLAALTAHRTSVPKIRVLAIAVTSILRSCAGVRKTLDEFERRLGLVG